VGYSKDLWKAETPVPSPWTPWSNGAKTPLMNGTKTPWTGDVTRKQQATLAAMLRELCHVFF